MAASFYTFLTVRYSSTRLAGKCLRKIGEYSVLEHVALRAKSAGLIPLICTSTDSSDDLIENEAIRLGIQCYRGELLNKVQRWRDCARSLGIREMHLLDADDPFFDCDEVLESINKFKNSDLDILKTSRRSDSGFASVGTTISLEYLDLLVDRIKELPTQDLDVIPWDLVTRDTDKIQTLPDRVLIPQEIQLRLTLDYPEDLELIDILATQFGPFCRRIEIEEYLASNFHLIMKNSHRTKDFLNNKIQRLEDNFGVMND